jgi:hypothetical protein
MPIALIAILVVIIAGVGFYFSRTPEVTPTAVEPTPIELPETSTEEAAATNETPTTETVTTAPETTPTTPPVAADSDTYKDGSFTANASYTDPGRKEYDIEVTLTIADDVVTAASVLYNGAAANTPNHTRFENGYKQEVIGKSLDSISLSRVGGASLTTEAFNDAVATIKAEAKS